MSVQRTKRSASGAYEGDAPRHQVGFPPKFLLPGCSLDYTPLSFPFLSKESV